MGIPHTRSVLRLDSLTQEKGKLMCDVWQVYNTFEGEQHIAFVASEKEAQRLIGYLPNDPDFSYRKVVPLSPEVVSLWAQ